MELVRVLALFVALLPSTAGAVIYRVDFVAQDLHLSSHGAGASFVTLPADGVIRGAYFYNDNPSFPVMDPASWELPYRDGETGAIVQIGPDVFTLITRPRGSDEVDGLFIFLNDDNYFADEETPADSYFFDSYRVVAQDSHPGPESFTWLFLEWRQRVLAVDVVQGAPLPNLLTELSYTELPNLTVPLENAANFLFQIKHGLDLASITGDVTDLTLSFSPVPEPDQRFSLAAGAVVLAALSRRRSAASIARSISS